GCSASTVTIAAVSSFAFLQACRSPKQRIIIARRRPARLRLASRMLGRRLTCRTEFRFALTTFPSRSARLPTRPDSVPLHPPARFLPKDRQSGRPQLQTPCLHQPSSEALSSVGSPPPCGRFDRAAPSGHVRPTPLDTPPPRMR